MAAVCECCAAERVAKRLGPEQRRRLTVSGEGGAAMLVYRRAPLARQPIEDIFDIGLDVGEFFGL
jgi:hypothetical protein